MKYLLPALVICLLLVLFFVFRLKLFSLIPNNQNISAIKQNNCNNIIPTLKSSAQIGSRKIYDATGRLNEVFNSLQDYNGTFSKVSADSYEYTSLTSSSNYYQNLVFTELDSFNKDLENTDCNNENLLAKVKKLKDSFHQIVINYQTFYDDVNGIIDLINNTSQTQTSSPSSEITPELSITPTQ